MEYEGWSLADWLVVGSIAWGPYILWWICYALRYKSPVFMFFHREIFLDGFWRKGMCRLPGILRIAALAAAMEMYRRSPEENKRQFNKFTRR